jgi:hypothetical protein
MLYLLMEVCGLRNVDIDHAASHVVRPWREILLTSQGKALATVTLLRATSALAKRNKVGHDPPK